MRSCRAVALLLSLLALETAPACLRSRSSSDDPSTPLPDAAVLPSGDDAGGGSEDGGGNPPADAGWDGGLGDGVLLQETPEGPVAVRAETIDFGAVLLGSPAVQRQVTVRNDGAAALEVTSITSDPTPAPGYTVPEQGFTLEPGATHVLDLAFAPIAAGTHRADVTLRLQNAVADRLTLTLLGRGEDYGCQALPAEGVDFGSVALGLSETRKVHIVNSSSFDWTLTVAGITSDLDSGAFAVVDASVLGSRTLAAGTELAVDIAFSPTHLSGHRAALAITAPAGCQPDSLTLAGTGVDDALDCEPKVRVEDASGNVHWECQLDFGYVPLDYEHRGAITFRNVGNRPITLAGWAIDQGGVTGAPFRIASPGTGATVAAAGGTVTLEVAVRPTEAQAIQAQLTFFSDDPKQPHGEIHLIATGGGPRFETAPAAALDFGINAVAPATRVLSLRNTGWDLPGTSEDNLRFAEPVPGAPGGGWQERAPELVGSAEFSVDWPPAAYGSVGVIAGSAVDVNVRLTPTGPGLKTATLRIYSNDVSHPYLDVALSADVRDLAPCALATTLPSLNFGNVDAGQWRTLTLGIRNSSTDPLNECLVTGVRLGATSAAAFSLLTPLQANQLLKGGERLDLAVKYAPTATAASSQTGTLEVTMANPGTPLAPVALTGTSLQSCLTITSGQFDFGAIQQNCNSGERSFWLYNGCSATVSVTSIALQAGATSEFTLSLVPTTPSLIVVGGSAEFRVTYRPTDLGPDRAIIQVQTTAVSATPQLVAVSGEGTASATRTDRFLVERKVDVLLVVDDSCSMSTVQTQLSTNISLFMQEAIAQQADYHLAVTTTSADVATDPNGRFVPLTGTNPRIITPTTPTPAAFFSQNVQVGTLGSGYEKLLRPTFLALSPPLVGGTNAGFLRADASLGVLFVSDAADQDTVPALFYERFLLGLKDGDRNRVTASGLIATQAVEPTGCYYDDYTSGTSPRVRDLIAHTGGLAEEICTSDYAGAFTRLGKSMFSLRARYYLSAAPDLTGGGSVSVELDGLAYPAVGPSGETRWSYDATLNTVEMTQQATLTNGSTLAISYPAPCL